MALGRRTLVFMWPNFPTMALQRRGCDPLRRLAAESSAEQGVGFVFAEASITAISDGQVGALVGQDFHMLQRRVEGVAIVDGIAGKAEHADDESLVQREGMLTLQPNLQQTRASPLEMQSTLRMCRCDPCQHRSAAGAGAARPWRTWH